MAPRESSPDRQVRRVSMPSPYPRQVCAEWHTIPHHDRVLWSTINLGAWVEGQSYVHGTLNWIVDPVDEHGNPVGLTVIYVRLSLDTLLADEALIKSLQEATALTESENPPPKRVSVEDALEDAFAEADVPTLRALKGVSRVAFARAARPVRAPASACRSRAV